MLPNITAIPLSLMVLLQSRSYSANDDGKRRHLKMSSSDVFTLLMRKRPKTLGTIKRDHHQKEIWTLGKKLHCHFQNVSSLEMFAVYNNQSELSILYQSISAAWIQTVNANAPKSHGFSMYLIMSLFSFLLTKLHNHWKTFAYRHISRI